MVEVGELVEVLFASGLSTRRTSRVLEVLYGMKLSSQTASRLAAVGAEEVRRWKGRRLEEFYPVVFLDATFFPLRRGNKVEKEPIYIALGIRRDRRREILGWWEGGGGESAQLWEEILVEMSHRGLKRGLLFVGDGLRGLEGAVRRVFSDSWFQPCLLHAVRRTLLKVRVRDRKDIADELKALYRASDREQGRQRFERFKERWMGVYPKVVAWWEEYLESLTHFLEFPPEIRGMIYTTNQLERLLKELKRRLKVMDMLPEEERADKILYLILHDLNERYQRRKLRGFEEAIEKHLDSISSELREKICAQTQLS